MQNETQSTPAPAPAPAPGTGTKVPSNFAELDYNITQIERTKEDLYKLCLVEINNLRAIIEKMEKEQKEKEEKETEDVHIIATT